VLTLTKEKLLREYENRKGGKFGDEALDTVLKPRGRASLHNHSPLSFEKLKGDPDHIDKHLVSYINGFSGRIDLGRTYRGGGLPQRGQPERERGLPGRDLRERATSAGLT
jgi:hypothetical protein